MNEYTIKYEKWRTRLLSTCLLIAVLIAIAEFLMFFVLKRYDVIGVTTQLYFIKYLCVPALINLMAVAIGFFINSSKNVSSEVKNYVPIVVMSIIGLCVASVHSIFPCIKCVFCVPIFLTAIYGNLRTTINTTILCVVFMVASVVYSFYFSPSPYEYLTLDTIMAFIILICAAFVAAVLTNYEGEKKVLLRNSFSKQGILKEQLLHDSMTGLYNHAGFYNKLNTMVECVGIQGVLAVIDIDDFKKLNDTYGHDIGDLVLTQFAYLLKTKCSAKGIPARYGGEEFAVIFPGLTVDEATEIMEDIRREFNEHEFEFLKGNHTSFSCGISIYLNGMSSQQLFNCADQAMYKAKAAGKNCIRLFP